MPRNEVGTSSFTLVSLPAEILLQLFTHFTDHDDVTCLRMTSRVFDAVYRGSSQAIVKGTMVRLAGSEDTLRLAFMAIQSSQVDSSDDLAVRAFIDQYVENGEVPKSFVIKDNLTPLGAVLEAAKSIASLKMACTQRAIQSLLRVEIAKNLFHDRLPDGRFNFFAPFPELERRFWQSHSESDIEDLLLSQDMLSSALRRAVNDAYDCPSDQYCRCREFTRTDVQLRVWIGMSQAAGLVPLATWAMYETGIRVPFNPYTRENRSHYVLLEYLHQFIAQPDWDELPDEDLPKSIVENALEAVRT
ncbi:hypothetical protein F4775DRAFT_596969 [Biscogniauxia sp. FL1348]|nr:hypothetical protein F4775DRAFT_596969 [Biscogniauxia sp. FL1348]